MKVGFAVIAIGVALLGASIYVALQITGFTFWLHTPGILLLLLGVTVFQRGRSETGRPYRQGAPQTTPSALDATRP